MNIKVAAFTVSEKSIYTLIKTPDWLSLLIGHHVFQVNPVFSLEKQKLHFQNYKMKSYRLCSFKAPITTGADDIFCDFFPNFPKNQN